MSFTNDNSDNLETLIFNKSIFSAETKRIGFVLLFPSFVSFSFYFKVKEGYLLIFGIILLVIAIIKLIDVLIKPSSISLTDEEIVMDDRIFKWSQIRSIQFTVPYEVYLPRPLLEAFFNVILPVQEIRILTNDNFVVEIYPRIYKENKKLREMFEKIAKQKGIRTKIDDRGM